MRIIRAEHLGMCFGVRDAIALAKRQSEPITILGELVHNETVLDELRRRGIKIENEISRIDTGTVMVTAHGTSGKQLRQLKENGFEVVEATCPLVHHAHRALRSLVEAGYHPVIIGRRDHVEVRGMTGDLERFDVVLEEADIEKLEPRNRYGVVSQTTQPIDRVRRLVALIGNRFPGAEVRFVDTVCQPTKQRQAAALELAGQCDVVVVIGGRQSNNTRELVTTCARACPRVYQVQSAGELQREWFQDVETVGITAGTSTPDGSISEVEVRIQEFSEESLQPVENHFMATTR